MGHNLGMLHTWADPHKSNGCETKVDGQYVVIRSDDDISGGPWSSCSKTDFEAHYLQYKDNWCMEGSWYQLFVYAQNHLGMGDMNYSQYICYSPLPVLNRYLQFVS